MIIEEVDANNSTFNEDTKVVDLKRELLNKLRIAKDLTGKEIKMLLNYFIDNE